MIKKLSILILVFLRVSIASAWETAIAGVLTTPAAQGRDGRIYSTADDRALHCLDSVSGKEYWAYRPGHKLQSFTVVSPDGTILILTSKNELVSVTPGGRENWRYPLDKELSLSPAVDPYGTIYLVFIDNSILALNRTGQKIWDKKITFQVRDIFALKAKLILISEKETYFYHSDGTFISQINRSPRYITASDEKIFWQADNKQWFQLDPAHLTLTDIEDPFSNETLFPDVNVLVSYEGQLISGRQDWFMEAMEAGKDSYSHLYQEGSNPSRNRGINSIPDYIERFNSYQKSNSILPVDLYLIDSSYLNSTLKEYESAQSLQQLIRINPDYDLVFHDVLSDGQVRSRDVYRDELDEHSRYRIYGILGRWGDLNSRESLIALAKREDNPTNLAQIMDGLGTIAWDQDGRSMDMISQAIQLYPRDLFLQRKAVINASRMAKYNGNQSTVRMMELYNTLMHSNPDRSISKLIMKELRSY